MTEGDERRRRAERVPAINAFVKVHDSGQDIVFQTRDISVNGLFLYTKVARHYPMIKIGSSLQLELYGFDQAFDQGSSGATADHVLCKVVVVRMVEAGSVESAHFPTGFGVTIVDVSTEGRAALAAMVRRSKSEAG